MRDLVLGKWAQDESESGGVRVSAIAVRFHSIVDGESRLGGVARSVLRAKSTHEEDDETDEQHKAEAAAADGRTAKIKATATEEEEQNNHQENKVHGENVAHVR